MSFFFRLLRRQAFSVSINKADSTFLYQERGRRLRVPGEAMADGFAVYASAIRQWDNTPGANPAELIDDNERQRIATNIRNHFVDRGKNVYLS